MEFVQNMEACRKELQQLLLPSSWGSALLRALEQGCEVLWVLSLWLTSFLWVQHSCSRSRIVSWGGEAPALVLSVQVLH